MRKKIFAALPTISFLSMVALKTTQVAPGLQRVALLFYFIKHRIH